MAFDLDYLKELQKRGKQSKVYQPHQLLGLEIAGMLKDEKHKSLYIKLAKNYPVETLLELAKDISTKANVKNKGAYFMACMKRRRSAPASTKPKRKKK